jgi:hypothetical protein
MKRRDAIIAMLLISLITVFLGISTAAFFYIGRGTTNNVIQTGRIIFSYSDAELGSVTDNGINITNALPTPDAQGKLLSNTSEYFDFSVSASTTSTDLVHEVAVNKNDASTMDEDTVKIFLTEFNGNSEEETEITGGEVVPTYAELKDTKNELLEGKTIYYGKVLGGEIAYRKDFRLRMWIKYQENPDMEEEKTFTVKVNVAAVGNN